ncbi:hypothetical protein BO94DRAFT_539771 [Aspergillus sclerotioniger CBS 115572]|uniref:Uncharacterized protein n=1 Tax=Aspergillus sclerotioniger CBS 115572 TaxID=1450535 RepID=A0A317V7I1_9EURO|nr:hypothetical protein BO94DRAFT_539771 [Aspergillus sclerotioniger CBS 115572]PWY70313.1 hypothetical protein BO94DRAFT_539771 [Aspergillus sclerotioniger CBS 115572]
MNNEFIGSNLIQDSIPSNRSSRKCSWPLSGRMIDRLSAIITAVTTVQHAQLTSILIHHIHCNNTIP